MTFVVVLTGGIASGKTTISDMFIEHGVPVIDTDLISKDLTRRGTETFRSVVDAFGVSILKVDGELDRENLRELVFSKPAQRKKLESILHPAIFKEVERQLAAVNAPVCLVVIPLLVETGIPSWANRVLVVDVEQKTQRERLQKRDSLSAVQVSNVIAAQADRDSRLAIADDVIQNNGDIQALSSAVSALLTRYIALSKHHY